MVEPQLLDGGADAPHRSGITAELDLGVHGADLHTLHPPTAVLPTPGPAWRQLEVLVPEVLVPEVLEALVPEVPDVLVVLLLELVFGDVRS